MCEILDKNHKIMKRLIFPQSALGIPEIQIYSFCSAVLYICILKIISNSVLQYILIKLVLFVATFYLILSQNYDNWLLID